MRHFLTILKVMLAVVSSLGSGHARAEPVPEYQMKAAYLYNLATFTTWPAQSSGTVRLCVLGQDRFGGALEKLTRSSPSGVKISLTYLSGMQDARGCQIMFIDASERDNAQAILKQLEGLPILTVTDSPELFQMGAIVGLFLENRRLSFDVNYQIAQSASLSMSSKLLRVARNVNQ